MPNTAASGAVAQVETGSLASLVHPAKFGGHPTRGRSEQERRRTLGTESPRFVERRQIGGRTIGAGLHFVGCAWGESGDGDVSGQVGRHRPSGAADRSVAKGGGFPHPVIYNFNLCGGRRDGEYNVGSGWWCLAVDSKRHGYVVVRSRRAGANFPVAVLVIGVRAEARERVLIVGLRAVGDGVPGRRPQRPPLQVVFAPLDVCSTKSQGGLVGILRVRWLGIGGRATSGEGIKVGVRRLDGG